MTPGEPFKPVELRRSSKRKLYPPAIVDRQRDITDGEKRLFRLLYGRAQTDSAGICWPSFKSLADDLGKSERQVKYDAKRLEKKRCLVRHKRRGARQSNVYEFLWHAIYEVPSIALHGSHEDKPSKPCGWWESDVQPIACREATPEVQSAAPSEVQDAARAKCSGLHTNSFNDCSQGTLSSSAPQQPLEADSRVDDDSSLRTKKKQDTVKGIMVSFITQCGYRMPSGPLRDEEVEKKLREIGGEPRDVLEFLQKKLRPRLKEAPNTWLYIETAILRHLSDPVTPRNIRFRKEAAEFEEKRRAEEERRQKARAEEERLMNEPMAPASAIGKAQERLKKQLPKILVKRLTRLGEPISPHAVIAEARAWRDCPQCRNAGQQGSAVKRTLKFCSCAAGEELRAEHGEGFLGEQIERANADLPARIAAAVDDLNYWVLPECLERCKIVDADPIEVTVAAKDRIWITGKIMSQVMAYIGDQRQVVVRHEGEPAKPEGLTLEQPEGPPEEPGMFDDLL